MSKDETLEQILQTTYKDMAILVRTLLQSTLCKTVFWAGATQNWFMETEICAVTTTVD